MFVIVAYVVVAPLVVGVVVVCAPVPVLADVRCLRCSHLADAGGGQGCCFFYCCSRYSIRIIYSLFYGTIHITTKRTSIFYHIFFLRWLNDILYWCYQRFDKCCNITRRGL